MTDFSYSFRQFVEARKNRRFSARVQSLEDFMRSELHEGKLSLPVLGTSIDDPVSGPAAAPIHGRSMLGAKTRVVPPEELQDYLHRAKSKDLESAEKYKMPYVHGSNITAVAAKGSKKKIQIVGENGKPYDLNALRVMITTRPAKILKQNEKIQHSGGGATQFYNIGMPALKGLAYDEQDKQFVVVDTCPGAGACQVYCYARKGGYIQWKDSSMSQTKMLNFLLNDPEEFKAKLSVEIAKAYHVAVKGGYKVAIRWHDAGDFFSNDYWELAKSVAESFPEVKFYAYTKMSDIATGDKPKNFITNFSGGAKSSEEKKVNFRTTKNSRVVARDVFRDFVVRSGGGRSGHLVYTDLPGLKKKLASLYGVDMKSVISYQELDSKKEGDTPKWNVIVKPGDGDDSAYRKDVIGTYLLEH